jgi:hypothetical protein
MCNFRPHDAAGCMDSRGLLAGNDVQHDLIVLYKYFPVRQSATKFVALLIRPTRDT